MLSRGTVGNVQDNVIPTRGNLVFLISAPVGGPPANAVYDKKGGGAPPWRRAFWAELGSKIAASRIVT